MTYAVEMYMDGESETRIRRIWQALAEAGIKSSMLDASYRPHISLAVCDELDINGLEQALSLFAENTSPFGLTFSNVGVFPLAEGVIFLGTVVTPNLLAIHAEFHRLFEKYAKSQREHYRVGAWIPHCTLAFGLPNDMFGKAIRICWEEPLPIHSRIEAIGIAEVSPISAETLCSYNLVG